MSMQCQYISRNHYMCLQTLDNDVNIYMYIQHVVTYLFRFMVILLHYVFTYIKQLL